MDYRHTLIYYFWVLGMGEVGGGGGHIFSRGLHSKYRLGSSTQALLSLSKVSPFVAVCCRSGPQGMIIFIGMMIPWKMSMKKKLMRLWMQKMPNGDRVGDLQIIGVISRPWSRKAKMVQQEMNLEFSSRIIRFRLEVVLMYVSYLHQV